MTPSFNTSLDVTEAFANGITKKEMSIHSWTIKTTKGRIFDSNELLAASSKLLKLIPFPEMFFGHNSLIIQHSSGFKCSFSALDAFLKVGGKNDLKVFMSSEWINSRKSESDNLKVINPYDWTFTTNYSGETSKSIEQADDSVDINIELLKQPDPILFYEAMPLYEDELGDNGCSELSVRIRVMPKCFLILQRFFLRVDHVLFRIYDTRIFHEWNQSVVIKEISHLEIPYDEILQELRKTRSCHQSEGEDLSILSDPQYIFTLIDKERHQIHYSKQVYKI